MTSGGVRWSPCESFSLLVHPVDAHPSFFCSLRRHAYVDHDLSAVWAESIMLLESFGLCRLWLDAKNQTNTALTGLSRQCREMLNVSDARGDWLFIL